MSLGRASKQIRAAASRGLALLTRGATDRVFALQTLERALGMARALPLFLGCERGSRVCATGYVRVRNQGRLVVGDAVTFCGGMIPTQLICHPGALLEIGSGTLFNYGASLEAQQQVRIGQRCLIASMVRIADGTGSGDARPIILEDEVWVAHGAILEPGVRIGAGSVVAAGAVVSQEVPPGMLAIGNPARCLRLEMAGRPTAV